MTAANADHGIPVSPENTSLVAWGLLRMLPETNLPFSFSRPQMEALAQADVGFALGSGANLARKASDLTFLIPDPTRFLNARNLSTLTSKILRRNLFFAFSYNALAIPLAASGYLNPLIAVFAMFASSLTVIGNASRLSRMEKN